MKPRSVAAPVVALLLLLSIAYVASYLALVDPTNRFRIAQRWSGGFHPTPSNYRFTSNRLAQIYWPLETLDRRIRPKVWKGPRAIVIP